MLLDAVEPVADEGPEERPLLARHTVPGDIDGLAELGTRKAGQQLLNDPLKRLQGMLDCLDCSLAQSEGRPAGRIC